MNNVHRKKRCADIINEQKTLLIKYEIIFFFLGFSKASIIDAFIMISSNPCLFLPLLSFFIFIECKTYTFPLKRMVQPIRCIVHAKLRTRCSYDSQEYRSRDFSLRTFVTCYLRIRNYFKNRAPALLHHSILVLCFNER